MQNNKEIIKNFSKLNFRNLKNKKFLLKIFIFIFILKFLIENFNLKYNYLIL